MSSGRGFGLFASDGKMIVRMLTMALLSVGVIAGSLFAYQQLTKLGTPNLISKDDATEIALKAGDWDAQKLMDKEIEATLLHVKANGFSFKVDEDRMEDTLEIGGRFPEYQENEYIWEIQIVALNNNWVYIINAETAEILLQPPYQ